MLFSIESQKLSNTDIHIYKYIMKHIESVRYMRIRDLANETKTSTASILRFCRKCGCQGYSEFRIRLQTAIYQQQDTLHSINPTTLVQFFKETKESPFQDNMKQAIQLLQNQELILLIGQGLSHIIAKYGAFYLSSLGYLAFDIEHFTHQNLLQKTCIIVLDLDNETQELVESLHHFKDNNHHLITITNQPESMIAKISDVCIPYYIPEEFIDNINITSQIPALYIIESLARELYIQTNKNEKPQ